ncbi:MAG: hypothetical protein KBD65_02595 [Candidatus Moranbacteria bacterium]|nr:hypothetical protein [Candidatus Moranbacteria bacterium]
MDAMEIARDNHAFYYVVVPRHMGKRGFAEAVLESFDEPAQYGIEDRAYSGYIYIDATNVKVECSHGGFADDVAGGLLGRVALKLPRGATGGLNTDVTIVDGVWKFAFRITKYERDGAHGYEPVEDPLPLPDGEKLGRFIELKISVNH